MKKNENNSFKSQLKLIIVIIYVCPSRKGALIRTTKIIKKNRAKT